MLGNFAFLDLDTPELLIILVIILLLFGGKKLPQLSRSIGESMRELRKGIGGDLADDVKPKKTVKNRQLELKDPVNVRFIEHLYELRKRLFYIACSILLWATIAYFIQQKLVNALLSPSHGQKFIYTSPIGGISFLFDVCIYFGIALSIPVIVYQILHFIKPVIQESSRDFIAKFSIIAGLLALGGIVFGYFLGLPLALGFLQHQFTNKQITPLFSIQEYMSFVSLYIVGSALLFQIPLIIWFIDRIKPLQPKKLFHYERWVILLAFIISAVMAPTINIASQLIIAGPIIVSYQLAIIIVWLKHRSEHHRYSRSVKALIEVDQEKQTKRQGVSLKPLKLADTKTIKPADPKPVQVVETKRKYTSKLINDIGPARPVSQA